MHVMATPYKSRGIVFLPLLPDLGILASTNPQIGFYSMYSRILEVLRYFFVASLWVWHYALSTSSRDTTRSRSIDRVLVSLDVHTLSNVERLNSYQTGLTYELHIVNIFEHYDTIRIGVFIINRIYSSLPFTLAPPLLNKG